MKLRKIAVLAVAAAASTGAWATDGYFAHGYGMKAKGMGGAATAMASDSMGGANNPASMVWAGDRFDVGVDFFAPKRKISRSGATAAGMNGEATSDSNLHYVPELGFNKMLGWDMSFGVTVYGNGGMNTDFPGDQNAGAGSTCAGFGATWARANLLCGNGRLGVDLMQVVVAPTFAMKINKQHSLGVSLLLAHQQFKANGIQSFAGFSETAANLSNLGRDKSNGVGLRLGWMGQLSDRVTMGAAYSPKTKMSKFDLYKGLFADGGNFDLPENWNVGIAFKPNDTVDGCGGLSGYQLRWCDFDRQPEQQWLARLWLTPSAAPATVALAGPTSMSSSLGLSTSTTMPSPCVLVTTIPRTRSSRVT
jgi:long-chain fatty acid transport protein